MKELSEVKGVLAVYAYKLPYAEIPLLVIDKDIDREGLKNAFGRSPGSVIITHDDIKHGRDVFALKFLHMQMRSSFIAGDKVLKELDLKESHIRDELESVLRILLIDLREMMMLPRIPENAARGIALYLDRILVGIEYGDKKHHKKFEEQLSNALKICEQGKVNEEFLHTLYKDLHHMTKEINDQ